MDQDHATFLSLLTRVYDCRHLPEHEQEKAFWPIEQEIRELRAYRSPLVLTYMLTPSFARFHTASLRMRAQLRCAVLGIACERFRLQKGRWPERLDELPAALTPFKNDPFTGTPLRLKKRDDGLTIYTVGPDHSDEGGLILEAPSVAIEKLDYGFRLYNPDQRNRPAK